MPVEAEAFFRRDRQPPAYPQVDPPVTPETDRQDRQQRNRLIAHLGRTFSRRYDMQVLPSGQRGVWACGLDPKITPALSDYISGQRDTLDDLPAESFKPRQILYDEQGAQEMSMDEITTILHHEAGHAKYTDFRLMIEGQRQAKDEGYLPTSFWLVFEGIEDPRVNSLEGEQSPAIDRQIRTNQGKDLQERITEVPLSGRPLMLQFAYSSFHQWLHGEPIPEIAETDVGRAVEAARPLLEQYFQNTDVDQRKVLQKQIWDIAKDLEKKDVEQEEMRQMAQQKGEGQQQGGQGEGQQSSGQQGDSGEQASGQGGQGESQPGIPNQRGGSGSDNQQTQGSEDTPQADTPRGFKKFMQKLKEAATGKKDDKTSEDQDGGGQLDDQSPSQQKSEKFDLSQLSPDELQELQDAIDQLSPAERAELTKQAREAVDEAQKEALEEDFSRTLKLQKNDQTGEYEATPQTASAEQQEHAQADFDQAVEQVEAEDQAEFERQEAERRQQEQVRQQLEVQRREQVEMQRAGFDPAERDKFLLYQELEDSMHPYVRRFQQAIEKIVPRRKEATYEGGHFSGPKLDRRDLIRRAPLGDEQFYQRQVEAPTGDPRLFIGLEVDNSASMRGKKMEQARKTIVFFAKACRDMGIPFMVSAFGDDAEVIKQFRQDFDNPSERIKPKIIDATDARGGSTNLHAGLEVTIEAMNEQRRRLQDSHGLIFVLTDGGANAGLTGDALRDYVEENRGRLTFKAFGLSEGEHERESIQGYLDHYFGESNCAYPEGIEDLPDEAARLLRVNLMQFQRFLS